MQKQSSPWKIIKIHKIMNDAETISFLRKELKEKENQIIKLMETLNTLTEKVRARVENFGFDNEDPSWVVVVNGFHVCYYDDDKEGADRELREWNNSFGI